MEKTQSKNISSFIVGILLIGAGILTFAGQVFKHINWSVVWPFILICAGAAFFAGMLLSGKQAGALAIPGSILTTTGLICLVQNSTGWWGLWSYGWGLIIASIGAGIALHGVYSNLPDRKERGIRLLRTGLILFLVFGIFFEFLYSTVLRTSAVGNYLWPAALIVSGAAMLIFRISKMLKSSENREKPDLFWPFILIAIGLVAIFANLNLLPDFNLFSLLNVWPLVLVVLGIQMLLRGISPWFEAAFGMITLAAILVFSFYGPRTGLIETPNWFKYSMNHAPLSANLKSIKGTGEFMTENRDVNGFSRISLGVNSRLEITQGNKPALTIQAEENLIPYIETKVSGDELQIFVKRGYNLIPSQQVVIQLVVQDLNALKIEGFGEVFIPSMVTEQIRLETNGASIVKIQDLQADLLEIKIDGGGTMEISGSAGRLELENNGAGQLIAGSLKCKEADIRVNGFAIPTVWVEDTLFVQINGAGTVSYYGNPRITREINGLGFVKDLGTK